MTSLSFRFSASFFFYQRNANSNIAYVNYDENKYLLKYRLTLFGFPISWRGQIENTFSGFRENYCSPVLEGKRT